MCETLREIFPKLLGERDDGDGNTNAPPLRPDKIHPRGRRGPSGSIGIFSKIGIGQFGRGSNSCGILSPSLGLFYYLQCCRHTLMRSNGSRQESMMVCLCYHYHVESQNVCLRQPMLLFLLDKCKPCQLQLSNSRQQHDKTPGHPGMSRMKSGVPNFAVMQLPKVVCSSWVPTG